MVGNGYFANNILAPNLHFRPLVNLYRERFAHYGHGTLFRAQAAIGRGLAAGGVWGDLVRGEYGVLYALSSAPDGLRLTDLQEDVLLTQSGMSRLLARLEARGLVTRVSDPDDSRAVAITRDRAAMLGPIPTCAARRPFRSHTRDVRSGHRATRPACSARSVRRHRGAGASRSR